MKYIKFAKDEEDFLELVPDYEIDALKYNI